MSDSSFRVGIIGCGRISGVHAQALLSQKKASLAALCDIRPEASAALAATCGNPPCYTDFAEMIRAERLDAVHLCLPHYLHSPVAVAAMELGCHVLTEKPLAVSLEQGRQMVEASERTGRRLGVIFQNRYNAGSRLLKSALDSGRLGRPLAAKCTVTWFRDDEYYTESDWKGTWDKEGGGVLVNQAIHTLDLMCWLLGYGIQGVDCSLANRLHQKCMETEDCAEGLIRFRDGVNASFWCTICYGRDAETEVEIVCEKGVASLKASEGFIRYADGTVETSERPAVEGSVAAPAYWGTSHRQEITDFYERLAAGQEPPITGREILSTTHRMLMALYESGRNRRPVVFEEERK